MRPNRNVGDPPAPAESPDAAVVAGTGDRGRVRHREHQTPGRPHRLSVRLSDAEWQALQTAACDAGLTPAGYAGKAVAASATGELAPAEGLAEVLKESQREMFAARRTLNLLASNVNQAAAAYNSTGQLPDWVGDA